MGHTKLRPVIHGSRRTNTAKKMPVFVKPVNNQRGDVEEGWTDELSTSATYGSTKVRAGQRGQEKLTKRSENFATILIEKMQQQVVVPVGKMQAGVEVVASN